MSLQNLNYNLNYGFNNALQAGAPIPIKSKRNPTSLDAAELGTPWVNTILNIAFILTAKGSWVQTSYPGDAPILTSLEVLGATLLDGTLEVAGAVTLDTTLSVTGVSELGQLIATADTNLGGDINLSTNGGTSETIDLINNQGTGSDAISINAISGGLILAGVSVELTTSASTAGNILLVGNDLSVSGSFVETNDALVGSIVFTGNAVIAGGTPTIVLTNPNLTDTTPIIYSVVATDVLGTGVLMSVVAAVQDVATLSISLINNTAFALDVTDSITLSYIILS